MRKEIEIWLQQALDDFEGAEYNFDGKKFSIAAFLCQQAIEKALKALLIQRTKAFPKIHDLTHLARSLDAPEKIVTLCAQLNTAYVASRYPDTPKKFTSREVMVLLTACKEVLEWAKKNLS